MAPKKENTKKVAGNAKKAEAAALKSAEVQVKTAEQEDQEWSKGAKSNVKKEATAAKAADAAAKKAEKAALLAAEEISSAAKPKAGKHASKKSKGSLDLGDLDGTAASASSDPSRTINASGIDNALDALSLTTDANAQAVERHPERRVKAAYKAFEARRMPEIEAEHPGLRKNQREQQCHKEFEKSPENPFNQVGNVTYDADKEDIKDMKQKVRDGVEGRLAEK